MKEQIRITEAETPLHHAGWRNLWFSLRDWTACDTGQVYAKDSMHYSRVIHPTKEAAEAGAQRWLRENERAAETCEYLGAFEEAA